MPTGYCVLLFLAISLFLCNTSIMAVPGPHFPIQIHIALPMEALPVNFTCSSGSFVMHPDEDHLWFISEDQVESCHAIWGHSLADFTAHDPSTDKGKYSVYWMAKLDGFFKTYDFKTWEKGASWVG